MVGLGYLLLLYILGGSGPVASHRTRRYVCPSSDLWGFLDAGESRATVAPESAPANTPLCYRVMQPASLPQALPLCHVQHASLYAWDGEPLRQLRVSGTGEDFLQQLAGAGVTNLWHGFYVRDDRFRQDTFPMPLERASNFSKNVQRFLGSFTGLNTSMADVSGSFACFEIALNNTDMCEPMLKQKRSAAVKDALRKLVKISSRTRRQSPSARCLSVKVKPRPCVDLLPFVCLKRAVDKDSISLKAVTPLCEADQVGSVHFNRCFSFGQEAVNYTTAQARCRAQPSAQGRPPPTLYDPRADNLDGGTFVNSLIANGLSLKVLTTTPTVTRQTQPQQQQQEEPEPQQQQQQQQEPETQPPQHQKAPEESGRRMGWVERGGSGECRAVDLDDVFYGTVSWDCAAHLPFYLCQQPVNLPAVSQPIIEVDQAQASAFNIVVSPLPGGQGDLEAVIPATLANPSAPVGLRVRCRYDARPPLFPGLQTMLLLKSGIPVTEFRPDDQASARKQTIEVELRNGYADDLRTLTSHNLTDYYWCEVNDLQTGTVHRSPRLFVRQEGMSVYAVSAALQPGWQKPGLLLLLLLLESWTVPWDGELFKPLFSTSSAIQGAGVLRPLRVRLEHGDSVRIIVDFHYYESSPAAETSGIVHPDEVTTSGIPVSMGSKVTSGNPASMGSTGADDPHSPKIATTAKLQAVKDIITSYLSSDDRVEIVNLDLDSLSVRKTDVCPDMTVKDPVSDKVYTVPEAVNGMVFTSADICLASGEPFVTVHCQADRRYGARWSQFTPIAGCNFTDSDKSPATSDLRTIATSYISSLNVDTTVHETKAVVDFLADFRPLDLVYLADIVQRVVSVGKISEQTGQTLLQLLDRVLQLNSSVLNASNVLGNATNRLLKAMDMIGDKVIMDDDGQVRLVSERSSVETWNLTKVTGDLVVGLELRTELCQFPAGQQDETLAEVDLVSLTERKHPGSFLGTDTAIVLPAAFLRTVRDGNPNKDVRLTMTVYADTSLFNFASLDDDSTLKHDSAKLRITKRSIGSRQPGRPVLNSKIVSARLTVNGEELRELKNSVVTTVFLPFVQEVTPESRAYKSMCVYWDFPEANGQGAWSTEGCRYQRTEDGRDVCECNHLTNFAVLLNYGDLFEQCLLQKYKDTDVYGQEESPEEHQQALNVLTIIGLSLSIAGLSLTVLSFILIRKLRQSKPQQTLFNMALAMLASWVTFLAGFSRVESPGGCLAVAVLLHYLILVSFMWMLMEGLLQYLLFVRVLGNDFSHYLLKTCFLAWGLPLIPVVAVLSTDVNLYRGGNKYCWMSLTPLYYAFLAPVAAVVCVNVVVYVVVVVNVCRRGGSGLRSSASNKGQVGVRASVACFTALGLSWVFAFLAVEEARLVFQYLFVIAASLQGFLIFLVFTARDPQIRDFWWNLFCGRVSAGQGRGEKSSSSYTLPTSPRLNPKHLNTPPELESSSPPDDDIKTKGGPRDRPENRASILVSRQGSFASESTSSGLDATAS